MTDNYNEIDFFLSSSEGGVNQVFGIKAPVESVAHWLNTPRGTIYGLPDWGHDLESIKHENINKTILSAANNIIFQGLLRDLPHIRMEGLGVSHDANAIDKLILKIQISGTTYKVPIP